MKPIPFLAVLVLISCGNNNIEENTTDKETNEQVTAPSSDAQEEIALTFINDYVDNCNQMNDAMGVVDWVNSNALATTNFKTALKKIMDDAYAEDPEMGLGADPIFDAQDFPENGFEVESFDEKTNYITLKGKDWPEFKLVIKLIEDNGNWLVDGCGMVNIPAEKRASR